MLFIVQICGIGSGVPVPPRGKAGTPRRHDEKTRTRVCTTCETKSGLGATSLVEVLDSCDKDVFPKVNSLVQVMLMLSVTSCPISRILMLTG